MLSQDEPLHLGLGAPAIYVLWHPSFADGASLAKSVFDWIRKRDASHSIRGSETPVYYRSAPWRSDLDLPGYTVHRPTGLSPPQGIEPDLQFPCRPYNLTDTSGVVVLPLIDEHMICDEGWRRHLYALALQHRETQRWLAAEDKSEAQLHRSHLLLVPVELASGYSQLHPVLAGINPVRVLHWRDGPDSEQRMTLRAERLCRHLTQVLVRHFRELDRRTLRMPRTVFLSHATADREAGVGVAEELQREALKLGQIDTFLNTTTLDWGKEWAESMIDAAGEDAAALVAVMSDHYAARPWCRREIQAARKLRAVETPANSTYQVWISQPVVIVDTLSKRWTRVLPEASGLPIVRWDSAEGAARALDRLMLEALQNLVHARYILDLAPHVRSSRNLHYLAVNPDPYTLMEWQRLHRTNEPAVVVYPGHQMLAEDEQRLSTWFGSNVQFVSLDDAVDVTSLGKSLDKLGGETTGPTRERHPPIALATGDAPDTDLAALGVGIEHVHEAILRWARALLVAGFPIIHSGSYSLINDVLEPLLEVSDSLTDSGEANAAAWAARLPWVQSYIGWPESAQVGVSAEARRFARCRPRRFDAIVQDEPLRRAESLTAMRKQLAEDCILGLAVGGNTSRYTGWAPGVLEIAAEFALAGKPFIPLSMFGGAARQLVRWLFGAQDLPSDAAEWVASWRGGMASDLVTLSITRPGCAQRGAERDAEITRGLELLRQTLAGAESYFGIPIESVHTIMQSDSVRLVRRYLRWSVLPTIAAQARQPNFAPQFIDSSASQRLA